MNGSWTAKHHEHHLEDHSRTCKWLVTLIYKPFRPFVKGTTLLRGLTITMVINHVSVRHGMILPLGFNCGLPVFGQTLDSWIPTVEPENPGRQKHHPLQQKETKMLPIPKKKHPEIPMFCCFCCCFIGFFFRTGDCERAKNTQKYRTKQLDQHTSHSLPKPKKNKQ